VLGRKRYRQSHDIPRSGSDRADGDKDPTYEKLRTAMVRQFQAHGRMPRPVLPCGLRKRQQEIDAS